jgi:peptidoglycan/LPS O-acetylase OafA/YrhL
MSFYLFIPLYAAGLGRLSRRRTRSGRMRAELIGVATLVAVSLAWRIPVLQNRALLAETMPNWLPAYLDQFALGMLLATASSWMAVTGRRPAWLEGRALPWLSWGLAALAFLAVGNIGLPLTPLTASPVGLSLLRQTLYGLFAVFLVAPAVFGPQDTGGPRRLLRFRPLALIGVVSYGVYLWHEAWIELWLRWTGDRLFHVSWPALAIVVTAAAIACATGSYILVERPVLRSGHHHSSRPVDSGPERPLATGAERAAATPGPGLPAPGAPPMGVPT